MLNYKKYKKFETIKLKDRTWPDKEIEKAPIWCSVDLRDGNQSLINPMTVEEKIEFFNLLVKLGFKEIEVGFPSASQIEYDFLRKLVDENLIPDDVIVQVLTQARPHLIKKTFESLKNVKKAIVHIYNSTSVLQRDVVFNMTKEEIKEIAIEGTKLVKEYAEKFDGEILLEYSPESFTGTEVEYALEICDAVLDAWEANKDNKVIINLPATVEMDTPNVFADQIEWMCRNFKDRERVILSVHPHNDRGTGVADAELALLAGADRVEGTLFGNGERTGNVDVLNIAYNMFSHGVNPELNLENINEIIEVYERCVKIPVHVRHPYGGNLVFTAFSGSHQDAINKGMKKYQERHDNIWQVPYLPIDPSDLGREYEALVRINSQSGKGGVAFVMDHCYGFKIPKTMQKEFADVIQKMSEVKGEISPSEVMDAFSKEYLDLETPFKLVKSTFSDISENNEYGDTKASIEIIYNGEKRNLEGIGNGPIDSFKRTLAESSLINVTIIDYTEHALSTGSEAKAASYVYMKRNDTDNKTYGVGVDSNITRASIRSMMSAINRLYAK
ncbi:2-isopropylmalate synthase [Clostridium saccharobutylicum]|uniref:2-isopropylmalate synthase n=1 Tax=Clostridium saccharobutylicum DSM 13864 TaxID=1345695 RepID=U5MQ62_CLOSA|nr:2-isopropylmalate synthase [Clostridium saccharobutylicum]AGX42730.1 2-isopropylmalate synthase LeuA [Clostridium saccharobutylicum DSM 13864]AQR90025.1 2-isopropylmalate synthase [Clostridium saccharobutylicum]AQR99930.1 2-isopropylmalate synthase [Clostridium saccharobutylicum]AQS09714.1 2-isopropylmalate synthase [Clostridium saccharobutylicum]AQS13914.1 2-isopropylmalate synthase [Clostridium saccharobutylicum]